jgi:hypothetical protein
MEKALILILSSVALLSASCKKCYKCYIVDANGNRMQKGVLVDNATGDYYLETCNKDDKESLEAQPTTTYTDIVGNTLFVGKYDCETDWQ